MRRIVLAMAALTLPAVCPGEVYHTRESALELAFAGADSIVTRQLFLSRTDTEQVRQLAGSSPASRLVTVHEGWQDDGRIGWAFLDTHVVRSSPETVMLVLDPQGRIRATHLLAFHEPLEYRPAERWLDSFRGRRLDRQLAPGRGIATIAGSTLTSHAVSAAVRRMLATWQVKLAGVEGGTGALASGETGHAEGRAQ